MGAENNEMLRHAVIEILAARPGAALGFPAVRRHAAVSVGFKFSDEELEASLVVLQGLGLAKCERDPLGSSVYWQATAAGVLAVERGMK